MRTMYRGFLAVAMIAVFTAPALAQADAWQNKWYWGTQGGYFITPDVSAVSAGGHWLITRERSGLYIAVDQLFYGTSNATLTDGTAVGFSNGRRFQGSLLAIPSDAGLQPYAGVGFVINQITDAAATGGAADAAAAARIEDVATKAFVAFTVGFNLRLGRKWAFYTQYQYSPSSDRFLLATEQHNINAGLRVVLSGSQEEVTTNR